MPGRTYFSEMGISSSVGHSYKKEINALALAACGMKHELSGPDVRTGCMEMLGSRSLGQERPAEISDALKYDFVTISVLSPRLLSPFRVKNVSRGR